MKKLLYFLSIFVLFGLIFILILYTPTINKYKNTGKLIISEVMPTNKNTIIDSYKNSSDYIEIYNGYDYDINLKDYFLSDDNLNNMKWSFPNVTIKAHDYLIVYASGMNTINKNELHTNFKLDKDGEVITLSDTKGKSLSKIYYKKTEEDTSYGYNGKKYVYYYSGTPNIKNNNLYSSSPIETKKSKINLSITEYILDNASSYKSEDNNYYSVIEIYNNENFDINLKDFYLSNDFNNKYKFKFPNVTIKANDYLVIYASGLNKYENDELHTNFILNNKDTTLILSDKYKNEIEKIYISNPGRNISCGYFNNSWKYYTTNSIGFDNNENYLSNKNTEKDIAINEVSIDSIELINLTNNDINLSNYSIEDRGKNKVNLPDAIIKANSYYVLSNIGLNINYSNEILYLYKNGINIDKFEVGKISPYISSGLNNNEKVFYKIKTLGSGNSNEIYKGYAQIPKFSINGGYVKAGTKIKLTTTDNSEIYYTLDGSFPTNNSIKYNGEIEINKNTVVKAIAYKNGYIESDIVSRTYIVDRTHDLAFISISTDNNELFGWNGLFTKSYADIEKKISFEFYEADGTLGTSFIGGTKLTGMDSRKRDQKSMAIYLRKNYGLKEITYPFFKENEVNTYSSFTLRNAGEDPFSIRIQDTVLTNALKGQMDIDMQDYRPVVVYINGEYYGLYNLREKLNGNYIENKFNVKKGTYDLIKYTDATEGTKNNYTNLVNYIYSHNAADPGVYAYLKTQIDMQELCNYLIVESYYGNTDLGNIRYFKTSNGKWRWMLYDLDWSLWSARLSMSYTVLYKKIPAVTYLSSTFAIARNLYRNHEFKDLYLRTLAYHLKYTFNPTRMNQIVDMQAAEIQNEMPYHIARWNSMYPSMDNWINNVNRFKNMLTSRYNYVKGNLRYDFNLSESEYIMYFGDL